MAKKADLLPDDTEPTLTNPTLSGAGQQISSGQQNGAGHKEYTVVARRYRPQTFDELIGQEHVSTALRAAIRTNRVGHAFLFTGARGTGKTTTARILAKALNCVQGPTETPCNQCEICQAISEGQDVDALEIDAASNRGIDNIRQLRQNVNIRPSRSHFKIYIIDEVHMLSNDAFNALLKTLEEPPEHVKFIFCTTEADKIPITILSRCQRFDFANVESSKIVDSLRVIAKAEGVEIESDALQMLARRAGGSMRDSQSLLEQLLAFGGERITVDNVNQMLGTAGTARMTQLARYMSQRNTGAALAQLDAAVHDGVDIGQLLAQLLGHFRDLMVVASGGGDELLLHNAPSDLADLRLAAKQLGIETILATMQIIDQTLARLRYSTHGRTLAELALVRICTLDRLESIAGLIEQARAGVPADSGRLSPPDDAAAKKKLEVAGSDDANEGQLNRQAEVDAELQRGAETVSIAPHSPLPTPHSPNLQPLASSLAAGHDPQSPIPDPAAAWQAALANLGNIAADAAKKASAVAIRAPNQLVVTFPAQYTFNKQTCERPENAAQLESALAEILGRTVKLVFALDSSDAPPEQPAAEPTESRRPTAGRQRMNERAQHPFVKRASELFNARVVGVEEPKTS